MDRGQRDGQGTGRTDRSGGGPGRPPGRLSKRHPGRPEARGHLCRQPGPRRRAPARELQPERRDRKSTRLNSSHLVISYAVFCLKKKNKTNIILRFHIKKKNINK